MGNLSWLRSRSGVLSAEVKEKHFMKLKWNFSTGPGPSDEPVELVLASQSVQVQGLQHWLKNSRLSARNLSQPDQFMKV
jgi:hypothetical protein